MQTQTTAKEAGAYGGYAESQERPPLASYAAIAGVFNAALAGLLAAAARAGRLPERVDAGDVLLAGTAAHKLSRLIAKDKVTA